MAPSFALTWKDLSSEASFSVQAARETRKDVRKRPRKNSILAPIFDRIMVDDKFR